MWKMLLPIMDYIWRFPVFSSLISWKNEARKGFVDPTSGTGPISRRMGIYGIGPMGARPGDVFSLPGRPLEETPGHRGLETGETP